MAIMVHVIKDGYHPHNTWERRPDGLYELAGSVYAFTDDQVKVCAQTEPTYQECACWETLEGHRCPKPDCLVALADRRAREEQAATMRHAADRCHRCH